MGVGVPPRTRRRGSGRSGLPPRAETTPQRPKTTRRRDDAGAVQTLANAMQRVGTNVQSGRVTQTTLVTFQAVALLMRELRAEAKEIPAERRRNAELRRLDGLAETMARTAARNASLLKLLTDDAVRLPGTDDAMRDLRRKAGMPEGEAPPAPAQAPAAEPVPQKPQVVPQSVKARQLANPFLAPDYAAAAAAAPAAPVRLLTDWELIEPLLRSFEEATGGGTSCMDLPQPSGAHIAPGLDLMPHQAQVVAAARAGHRTFLLADEPGLGKTAEALLAAQAANAFPLLVVVPNVVKTSWAREAAMWTPDHPATVVHSDGETIDAFSDIVIVNYDILNRHVGWLGTFGFRGMVIDEAHFIKNKTSLRSRSVLDLSRKIRQRTVRPLLMALTGTPLINDIEDFLAIWEFLGWIENDQVTPALLQSLERNGRTPVEPSLLPGGAEERHRPGHRPAAQGRGGQGHPRPAHRGRAGGARRSRGDIDPQRRAQARAAPGEALPERRSQPRAPTARPSGIDHELVRRVATRELKEAGEKETGENVFAMMRRIGTAKAELAADFTAQLSRNAGKVVFFAKHIDVMDTAEAALTKRGIKHTSIRGDQTTRVRHAQHRLLRQRRGRARHRLLADRRRRRDQPAGRVQRRARRAVLDRGRADPGDRPGPPDRPGSAGDGLAHPCRADRRHPGRRAHRREGRASGARPRRGRRRGGRRRSTSSSRRW